MTTLLDTAVLDRLTAEEGTKHTLSVTPVAARTTADVEWGSEIGWFVTGVYSGSMLATTAHHADLPGTIRKVRTHGASTWPTYQVGPTVHDYIRTEGAPLNPPLVNGRYYAILNTRGGGETYVIRYHDEAHAGDRHRRLLPFSIISGENGAAWLHDSDSLSETTLQGMAYIEVEPPATAGRPAVSEPLREHVDGGIDGPLMGLAVMDERGHVEVNPEPVEGQFYLFWDAGGSLVTLAQRKGGEWRPQGYYSKRNGGPAFIASPGIVIGNESRWALARLETPAAPEGLNLEERKANLHRMLDEQTSKWTRLDEALTDLAKDKDWCSEFEAFAEPLGFSPREEKRDWDVFVNVTFSAQIDSPDSSIDSRVGDYYDLPGLSMTSMSISGTLEVCVSVDNETEDYARDYVDTSVIYDAIDSSADITIDDWSIDRIVPA